MVPFLGVGSGPEIPVLLSGDFRISGVSSATLPLFSVVIICCDWPCVGAARVAHFKIRILEFFDYFVDRPGVDLGLFHDCFGHVFSHCRFLQVGCQGDYGVLIGCQSNLDLLLGFGLILLAHYRSFSLIVGVTTARYR